MITGIEKLAKHERANDPTFGDAQSKHNALLSKVTMTGLVLCTVWLGGAVLQNIWLSQPKAAALSPAPAHAVKPVVTHVPVAAPHKPVTAKTATHKHGHKKTHGHKQSHLHTEH